MLFRKAVSPIHSDTLNRKSRAKASATYIINMLLQPFMTEREPTMRHLIDEIDDDGDLGIGKPGSFRICSFMHHSTSNMLFKGHMAEFDLIPHRKNELNVI